MEKLLKTFKIGGIIIIVLLAIGITLDLAKNSDLFGDVATNIFKADSGGYLVTANMGDPLPNPTNGAVATSSAGIMAGRTTIYFKLTSLDYAGGQTAPSSELSCAVDSYPTTGKGTTTGCTVTFTPTTGAASQRLWVATTSGTYYGYVAATSSTLVLATSTGLTAGTIPTSNSAYYYNGGARVQDFNLQSYVTADTLVKSGKGFVHTITFSPTDAAATGGSIAILDATTAGNNATTTLFYVPAAAMVPVTITLDQTFDTGIYVDFTTTADVNVSISYR